MPKLPREFRREPGWRKMVRKRIRADWGKAVFIVTAVAMVEFFWWLLVLDHGAVAVH